MKRLFLKLATKLGITTKCNHSLQTGTYWIEQVEASVNLSGRKRTLNNVILVYKCDDCGLEISRTILKRNCSRFEAERITNKR